MSRSWKRELGTHLTTARRTLLLPQAPLAGPMPEFLTGSALMRALLEDVRRFAATGAPILIQGETGSGKELVARAVHAHSEAAGGPWVDINCAALPDHLAESELFGYEKGAFSGADTTKPGLFEMADGGTLFLDEIGELAPQLQGKLLRVLDHMEYFRLGGTRKIRVRTRVVAATNRSLTAEIERGQFRADLYHRLSAMVLEVPPLRDRRSDVGELARLFLTQIDPKKRFENDALWLLEQHDWPGNARELRNVVQRAAALALGDVIAAADLPQALQQARHEGLSLVGDPATMARSPHLQAAGTWDQNGASDWGLANMERRMIEAALVHTGGHQQRAASLLGLSRRTLSRKLRQWGGAGDAIPAAIPLDGVGN